MNKFFIMLALLVCCCGCVYEVRKSQIKNVTQIVLVDSHSFWVFCENPYTKEITKEFISGDVKIFADVSEFEPMWVDVETGVNTKYIFHIHSAKDIAGLLTK